MNYFQRVSAQTPTRFWINNVTREEALTAIAAGAVGCTQNPSYTWKMLISDDEKHYALNLLDDILRIQPDDEKVQVMLQRELVREIAKRFLPLYKKSNGREGFVSIQGSPLYEDTATMIDNARFNREAGENIMAKIPLTKEGLECIEVLLEEDVPVNATEVFGASQVIALLDLYNKVSLKKKHMPRVYYSHITGIYDEYLAKYVEKYGIQISSDSIWQAGMMIARKVYKLTREKGSRVGFIGGGARGLQHFTEMVGAEACITINWKGTAENLIEENPPVVDRFNVTVHESVLDELLEKIPDFRKGWYISGLSPEEWEEFGPVELFRSSFVAAWKNALDFIGERRKSL
jgi:transaldolase